MLFYALRSIQTQNWLEHIVIFEHYFISDHFKSDQHKLKISQGFLR